VFAEFLLLPGNEGERMIDSPSFDYLKLPYCGTDTAKIAKRLSPYYHCVFTPFVDQNQIDPLTAQGFYCRASIASQDLPLELFGTIKDLLSQLPAKRRNDIVQVVKKAREQEIEITVEVFRQKSDQFQDIYTWYFEVYRPYAATHFANKYKYSLIEDLHADLLGRFRSRPSVLAIARWQGKIIGASFLFHIACPQYRVRTSFAAAFPRVKTFGDVLQMSTLNSGPGPIGNINTYLYYCLIQWCIQAGYGHFSFGRENLMVPPNEYLNVLGSKRSWGTTTLLENDAHSLQFVLCNRRALLHLRSDYFLFLWTKDAYRLVYFANDKNVPKALSQTLESDAYIEKHVYTRNRSIFSYLEKRAARWKNARLVLCSPAGIAASSVVCP